MAAPTREEYEKALGNVIFLKDSISLENKRREKIIKELCKSQSVIENYEVILAEQKEIVDRYQIYQEILKSRQ